MKTDADVIGVSRSNLHDRVRGRTQPRRSYHKAEDAAVLPRIQKLVAKAPDLWLSPDHRTSQSGIELRTLAKGQPQARLPDDEVQ